MNSQKEEKDHASRSYSEGELESPFLENEWFSKKNLNELENFLVALEAESAFQQAFEQDRTPSPQPEEPEDEFYAEQKQAEDDNYEFFQSDLTEPDRFEDQESWDLTDSMELEAAGCTGEHELSDYEYDLFDSEIWQGTAEQIAFRNRVLTTHISLSRKRSGPPKKDLSPDELAVVPGTTIRMGVQAAAAAGRLLAAANAALAQARAAGHTDALHTIRLTATSGNRGQEEQKRLWLQYFGAKGGYYDRTQTAREKLADGQHSEQAVTYMLTPTGKGGFGLGGRIAAPGYSNHQGGIAIDFFQVRRKGHEIRNKSDANSRAKWRKTWFHEWLRNNAHLYGFQPIPTEEWHWEFRKDSKTIPAGFPTSSSKVTPTPTPTLKTATPSQPADYLGGKLVEFFSATPIQVAVFLPRAASTSGKVDVLVYVHGLFSPCPPVPKRAADLITKPPFALGKIVDTSKREIILAVPFLSWKPKEPHPLGAPAKLNRFVSEILTEAGRMRGTSAPLLRCLILAGHSRAYGFLDPLAKAHASREMTRGALSKLTQVWAFDTSYTSPVDTYRAWFNSKRNLAFHVFYRKWSWKDKKRVQSGTKAGGENYEKLALRLAKDAPGRFNVKVVSESHCSVPVKQLPVLLALSPSEPELEKFEGFKDFEFHEEELDEATDEELLGESDEELSEELDQELNEELNGELNKELETELEDNSEISYEDTEHEFDQGIEFLEDETEDDEAVDILEAREFDPVLLDIAERTIASEVGIFEEQLPTRWTSCFSASDIARAEAVYKENEAAANANSIDRNSCIVMLNVALGKLLSLPLKSNRSRSVSTRIVQMANLTTQAIEKAMKQLIRKGYALRPTVMNFFDRRNRTAGTLKPERLKTSIQANVLAKAKTKGCWFAFGLSIMDGYHSVLLLVDRTGPDGKIYWLDQFSGGITDDVTTDLDQRITSKTQTWWQAVKDRKGKGYNTTIRLWPLKKITKPN